MLAPSAAPGVVSALGGGSTGGAARRCAAVPAGCSGGGGAERSPRTVGPAALAPGAAGTARVGRWPSNPLAAVRAGATPCRDVRAQAGRSKPAGGKRWRGAKMEVETVYSAERGWLVDYDALVQGTTSGLEDDDVDEGEFVVGDEDDDDGEGDGGLDGEGADGGAEEEEVEIDVSTLPPLKSLKLPPRRKPAKPGAAGTLPPAAAAATAAPTSGAVGLRKAKRGGLKIIAGSAGGRRLLSPVDMNVRPMMEVVRAACFSMLASLAGPQFLAHARWLDLYSGTGAVGMEALSRGAAEAHFVELDPWVIGEVLGPNLDSLGFGQAARVHPQRVEDFLAAAEAAVASAAAGAGAAPLGGWAPFDFVSVTPPYEQVSYTELMAALGRSPLLLPTSFVLTEYPRRDKMTNAYLRLGPALGPLVKLRDRRYGRTNLAIYGPAELVDRAEFDELLY